MSNNASVLSIDGIGQFGTLALAALYQADEVAYEGL
jgi:hypothetical protein